MIIGSRRWRVAVWVAAVPAALLLVLALFPWGLLVRQAATPLSRIVGRPVTVGTARRGDWIGFVPTIELRDVRIAQPDWAGMGDLVRIDRLSVRLPVLPLLLGRVRPRSILIDGMTAPLIRDARGRDNWSSGEPSSGRSDGGPGITDLTIHGGHIRLDDARRHVVLTADLVSDERRGLRVEGAGSLRGKPLRLVLTAPAIAHADPFKPFPAALAVRSPLVSIDAQVRMDHPLDTGHFSASLRTSGRDLGYLDDIIQAGLFRTQSFDLVGDVRHAGPAWHIAKLGGTIGRSAFVSSIDVTKQQGRTKVQGRIDAKTLDFDDFASDEQRARAAVEKRREGPRVIPSTRIVLDKLDKLDGRIDIKAAALLAPARSPFRALEGVVSLDHQVLTLSPVTVTLPTGRMTGRVIVDGRGPTSKWQVDLRIAGATVESFFPDQQVMTGPMRGRVVVSGVGPTLRGAVAGGRGRAALVVDRGTVRRDYATFLGGDVLKSVGAAVNGKAERTDLQCLVANFALGGGRLVPNPLVLATPAAGGDGAGSIMLPSEAIDLRVSGKPTRPGLLQSTAPVRLFGTLSEPKIDIRPPRAKNQKGSDLLSRVGFFVKKLRVRGDADATAAAPVACGAIMARALR